MGQTVGDLVGYRYLRGVRPPVYRAPTGCLFPGDIESMSMGVTNDLLIPPAYCHYADGPCDQNLGEGSSQEALFLYPSTPGSIAATIEAAIEESSKYRSSDDGWKSWKSLPVAGHIIFCEICKAMRHSSVIVADVTTLNFNLLYEIGFALGLGLTVIPIRDTGYIKDKKAFEQLGILDTLGYVDFTNGAELAERVAARLPATPLPRVSPDILLESPMYVLKAPTNTEGDVRLLSAIKKSALRFRSFDPGETPRLSLLEARRQVARSVTVVAHLVSPHREGSAVHNGRCALIGGLATAQKKAVLLLQEEEIQQPIDYRDIVKSYTNPNEIVALIEPIIRRTVENIQLTLGQSDVEQEASPVQLLDLGDRAAENEISGLQRYFVPTGQSQQAAHGHARLVVGRKGAGKTAIFYEVRQPLMRTHSRLVLDLKPEGPHFVKLREFIDQMTPGLQQHTMMAFWTYILLAELARKILDEYPYARLDRQRLDAYEAVEAAYGPHNLGFDADFSQRLLREVERITERWGEVLAQGLGAQLTEYIFAGDVHVLRDAVSAYLREKEEVWVLVDNLDKGWPIRGSTEYDILILRGLLDATRKLQSEFEDRGVEFKSLVFLRTDIYDHLVRETPDKGKDTAIRLDWDDAAVFEEIVRRRIESSAG